MSIKAVLIKHYDLYPKMQIQDMIKLIYQNEFAGGHLIENEDHSLHKLQDEYRSLEHLSSNKKMSDNAFESIGNNLCRLHLAALKYYDINLNTVNRLFISTANSIKGSIQSFEEKLDVLRQCCKEGQLPYSLEELEAYLCSYKKKDYTPVSHSEIFRDTYLPAYRIVRSKYCDFFEVFCRIDSLMKSKDRIKVAIEGNSGAGKSTLASLIGNVYECNIFHMDDFFLTPELKTEERLKEVGGNVDYVRFKHEVINGINSGREFQYHKYDCKQKILGEPIPVTPHKLNIIEGSYSMHPTLIDNYDLKIFLHINEEEQSSRILKRNGASMLERFLCEWIPLENQYFKELNIEEQSDLVFKR
jgi:uridine kinase